MGSLSVFYILTVFLCGAIGPAGAARFSILPSSPFSSSPSFSTATTANVGRCQWFCHCKVMLSPNSSLFPPRLSMFSKMELTSPFVKYCFGS